MAASCTCGRCPRTRRRPPFRSPRLRSSRRSRPASRSGTSRAGRRAPSRPARADRRTARSRGRSSAGTDRGSPCGCDGSPGRGCATTSRRRAAGSSSAKSVSIACTPPAASPAFSSISSVVSDLTLTTSVTPCCRAMSRTIAVRLGGVARPVHDAAGRDDGLLELHEVVVEVAHHIGLDRASGVAQLLPVGHLGDDARSLLADRGRRVAQVAAQLRVAERRAGRLGEARHEARISARCIVRIPALAAREAAADLHQARAVDGGADLGAASRPRRCTCRPASPSTSRRS